MSKSENSPLMITLPKSDVGRMEELLYHYKNFLELQMPREKNTLFYNAIGREIERVSLAISSLHPGATS